uniref:Uncharacterized protein n=1 Tax=Glossina austeni TaxID=7395 RepID=A0A1A9UGF4_GLOAU
MAKSCFVLLITNLPLCGNTTEVLYYNYILHFVAKVEKTLQRTVAEVFTSKKIKPKVLVEIKDMDESTERTDIIDTILKATDEDDMEEMRIRNINKAFGQVLKARQQNQNKMCSMTHQGKRRQKI